MAVSEQVVRRRSTGTERVIRLASGRTVDISNVIADRLMSVAECQEVVVALRQRINSIERRLPACRTDLERVQAEKAVTLTIKARNSVLGRQQFLAARGDQHVELMSDAALFVAVARERLGRDVFEAIRAEARRRGGGGRP